MPVRSPTDPRYFFGDWNTTLSAAGTTQETATAVNAFHNWVDTCAAGAGVVLVAKDAGNIYSVVNAQGVNALLVYPWSGANFNGATADDPVSVPPNGRADFFIHNATKIGVTVWGA